MWDYNDRVWGQMLGSYGPGEIYVADFDGHAAQAITTDNAIVARPTWVPGRLANPVWVDHEDFEISDHVRRTALPRPGGKKE